MSSFTPAPPRVLVVGTTADYIELLALQAPGRVLFVTDPEERNRHAQTALTEQDEILCPLDDDARITASVTRHLEHFGISLAGITCFDCESMGLTARLASALGLPFHSVDAIAVCRSKYHAKVRWQAAGLDCPRAALVRTAADALKFWRAAGRDIVLKPLTGSGSELVFRCRDEESCTTAVRELQSRVPAHPNQRMYGLERLPDNVSAAGVYCAESYVGGTEYSCDALIHDGELTLVRLTRKRMLDDEEFGTIAAYQMLNTYPAQLPERELRATLKMAARRLGLYHAWFMADFKVDRDRIFLLEITPRPGGDCLPPLLKAAGGPDVLSAMLDFAAGERITVPPLSSHRPVVGLHCYASRAGRIRSLALAKDMVRPAILAVHFHRRPGDLVRMPPEDYESRKLGYIIFSPRDHLPIEAQCREIRKALHVEMEETVDASR